jgi:predicted nucleic acid-binding protein
MTLVIDASVAVKWILPEIGSDDAASLRAPGTDLIAPSLVIAEIGNALWKKCLRGEVARRDTAPALRLAISQFTGIVAFESLADSAIELAVSLRHPIYDCFYIALAERENAPLVTADENMIAAAKKAKIKVQRL